MESEKITYLKAKAGVIRRDILISLAGAGSGHTGGSLGLADVFTVLYFHAMRHDPKNPAWEERDRLVLSIGHVAPALYATLAHAGYFPKEELQTLRKLGSRLQGHPGREHGLPGLELSAGSLGQGLSVATGMALAGKIDQAGWRVYCLCGDGELQEGSVWEAAMSAAHHRLGNLTVIIDRNGVQIDGPTRQVMDLEPLEEKWKAFGWEVVRCDGHDMEQLAMALQRQGLPDGKPRAVIASTLMGKGVPSIEGDYRWHGRPPSPSDLNRFLTELGEL